MGAEPVELESRINYRFSNQELLQRALTHSSFAYESRNASGVVRADNEQLEFLGDAVLGFLASDALVRRYPDQREGHLSCRKAHLVSAAHLHGVARRLDLGSYLVLGRSEEKGGGRSKKTLLVDALEALIAAIFLDGGMEAARTFVLSHILDAASDADEDAGTDVQPAVQNFKNALHGLALSRNLPAPQYTVIREQGPEHSKIFTVEVELGRDWTAQAAGRTKKIAAQRAARSAHQRLRQEEGSFTATAVASLPYPPDAAGTYNYLMNLRPLHDRVVVKRLEEGEQRQGGIIIPDSAKEKPQQAEVVAVGNGKLLDSGERTAVQVKKGDRILFGKYSGSEIKLDGSEFLILKEDEILGVLE